MENEEHVNSEITEPIVHVRVFRGSDLGIMPIAQALEQAQKLGLDLVLRSYEVKPPICEIIDMSRSLYKDEIEKEAKQTPYPALVTLNMTEMPSSSNEDNRLFISTHELASHFSDKRQVLSMVSARSVQTPFHIQKFLQTVGLPDRVLGNYKLDFGDIGLFRLDEYMEWYRLVEMKAFDNTCRRLGRKVNIERNFVAPFSIDIAEYYRLGEYHRMHALVMKSGSTEISIVDIMGKSDSNFPTLVNSSVEQFAQFIYLMEKAYSDINEMNYDIKERLKQLHGDMSKIDPKVMKAENTQIWLSGEQKDF